MTTEQKPRIDSLLPSEWDDEILDALGAFPHGLKFVLNGWEEGELARGANMLGSFARYPALAKGFLAFNNHVAANSTLTARERELLILRTGWIRKCPYEFVMHIILGRRAGLSDEEIDRTQQGPDASGWSAEDADLLRAADELLLDARISDGTWDRLSRRYDHHQMMDIVFAVGCYDIVAMATNSFEVPLEPGVETLEAETRDRMSKANGGK